MIGKMREKRLYNMNLNLRSEVVTWNEYQRNVNNLCKQITDKYDFLIGVFQGGYIVALSIADKMIDSAVGGIISKKDFKTDNIFLPNFEENFTNVLKGKKVLLIDEVVDSGYSLLLCKKALMCINVKLVHSACLYLNTESDESVEYYVKKFDGEINYIFPWRYNRDVGSLLVDVMKNNHLYTIEDLRNSCHNIFDIEVECSAIDKILNRNKAIFEKVCDRWRLKNEV